MRVFIADLGHNQLTLSSDVYPLGVANLAAYAKAHLDIHEPLKISIFREPQDLKKAIDDSPPDVLGLSSYSWNHELSLSFARYAKARSPEVLTLMGGPNFPLTSGEQETFLRSMPKIDVAVRGPTYESERALKNIIKRFSEVGHSLEGLQEEPVPGNLWINQRTNEFIQGAEVERIRDLDEIPSPYLNGWMEPFFKTGYFPMVQISRGCPFECSFCNSAVKSNNKVFAHSTKNVESDLLYIAQHVRPEITLCFADDNFGMYPWDEEIVDYISHLQNRFNWPQYIRTTTGKNRHDRIIRVMRKAKKSLPMTAAVQSMNPEVLKNIKRSNIKLETYAEIHKELKAQGMQSYGELILCLPGETKASFMRAIHDFLESGVKRVSAHQLMLLPGAPLSNPESRERFGLKTRFRVVARNIGNYAGEPVIEVEEMVVETPSFSFQEYIETRIFHLLLTIFYYEGNFEEAFEFSLQGGTKPFDLITRLQAMLNQAPKPFQTLIEDFERESREELFNTKKECIVWAHRNFSGLLDGSLGGNLLSKYSMLGRFFFTQEAVDFLETGIAAASPSGMKPVLLRTVMEYLRAVLIYSPFAKSLASVNCWTTSYDVEAWKREGYVKNLGVYRYSQPQTFTTFVEPERKALIESRLRTFGEHPSGLGKFTRTMFAQDLRRRLAYSESSTEPMAESFL